MKITRIETIPVRVPIHARLAIRGKGGMHAVSPFLLVKVHTSEGICGLGEVSATPRWSGEDQVTAAHFIESIFAPLLVGQDPSEVETLSARTRAALFGNTFTKAAIEMALWDIAGKAAGVPVCRLLGGPVRARIPIKWSISGVDPVRASEIAAWALEKGFRTMKVKVGIDAEQDIARVRAVRDVVGAEVRLGVDANGAWDVPTAIRMIRALGEFEIYFAEQPVAPGDPERMAEVRRSVDIPVLADESVCSVDDAAMLIRASAASAFSIYVGKSAGIGPARTIAATAAAAGIPCTVGSNLELGVATAAMIHLAAATHGIDAEQFPCDIIGPLFYTEEILREPLRIADGHADLPQGIGLGVELDDDAVLRFRV